MKNNMMQVWETASQVDKVVKHEVFSSPESEQIPVRVRSSGGCYHHHDMKGERNLKENVIIRFPDTSFHHLDLLITAEISS